MMWQPYFPVPALVTAAITFAVLAFFAYLRATAAHRRHARPLLAMRLLLLAALLFLLLGPSRLPPAQAAPDRPTLEIWMDTSASMAATDMDEKSRYDFAVEHWLDEGRLARLAEDQDLRFHTFDETSRECAPSDFDAPVDERAIGASTHLVDAIYRRLDAITQGPPRSMLLLSDGHDSGDASLAPLLEAARRSEVAVHTVTLGGPRLERDLGLLALPRQDFLLPGEAGSIEVEITPSNAGRTRTHLRVTSGGRMKDYPVSFDGDRPASVNIPIRHEEPGLYEYALSVDPIPGEVEERNNHQTLYVEVTSRRFRVLLLEGEPYWDTKFLAQALRRDERIELVQLSQISTARRETLVTRTGEDLDPGLPRDLDALSRFDVVILGRSVERITGAAWLTMLPDYVDKRGGRLILARGPLLSRAGGAMPATPGQLRVLEPVYWGEGRVPRVRMQLEPAGRVCPALQLAESSDRNELIFRSMPRIEAAWMSTPKPSARVLASFELEDGSDGPPALATLDYGGGKVLAVLGDGLWRWRLLERERKEWGGVFEQFWRSMVRWMVASGDLYPQQDVTVHLAPRHVRKGESVRIQVSSRNTALAEALKMTLTAPDGTLRELALHHDEGHALRQYASVSPEQSGVYRLAVEGPRMDPARLETCFDVYELDAERLQSSARPGFMRRLARETGGTALDPRRPEDLAPMLERREAAREIPPRPEYTWNHALVMLCILTGAGAEWIARRRWGWI